MSAKRPPSISIVIPMYNMRREAPRTLHTLSRNYQVGIESLDYEVCVLDHGSSDRLDPHDVEAHGAEFRYEYVETEARSPAAAMNRAIARSRGEIVCVMNDGARMLSPGVLRYAAHALRAFDRPVVSCLGWHLGPDIQNRSMLHGYDQQAEDRLLATVDWRKNGYELFGLASLAGSSEGGWFRPMSESNCIFMPRDVFEATGGLEERFQMPSGGILALDFFREVQSQPDIEPVVLLGEGTFHQYHGGTITNVPPVEQRSLVDAAFAEYQAVRGRPFSQLDLDPIFLGRYPPEALAALQVSTRKLADELGGKDSAKRRKKSTWTRTSKKLRKLIRRISPG